MQGVCHLTYATHGKPNKLPRPRHRHQLISSSLAGCQGQAQELFFSGSRVQPPAVMEPSRSSRVKACLLYFFLFMSYGCVAPFMPLIWRSKGLSGEHQQQVNIASQQLLLLLLLYEILHQTSKCIPTTADSLGKGWWHESIVDWRDGNTTKTRFATRVYSMWLEGY